MTDKNIDLSNKCLPKNGSNDIIILLNLKKQFPRGKTYAKNFYKRNDFC